MKRRKFFKNAGLSVLGTAIPFKGEMLSFNDDLLASALSCAEVNNRVLVILRMQGANDGLNTFVPDGQYDLYKNKRPKIHIKKGKLNSLDSTKGSDKNILLHPSMAALKKLYENREMSIIHGVGYDDYNYSHFTSDQVLWKGSDEDPNKNNKLAISNGMLARYIAAAYKVSKNEGIINGKQKDPYVIQFGNPAQITSFKYGSTISFEFNGNDFLRRKIEELEPSSSTVSALVDRKSNYANAIYYINEIEKVANAFAIAVEQRFRRGYNMGTYTEGLSLHRQLKMVARLIKGGAKTKIYQCTLTGFDTHAGQVSGPNRDLGRHADLLKHVSSSIVAFMDDLKKMELEERVVLMSYSEFGRKVIENGTGTDHGNLNPMFLIGTPVNPGIFGTQPDLNKIDDKGRFLETETKYNFKQVYAGILRNWLGANDDILKAAIGTTKYPTLTNLIKRDLIAKRACSLAKTSAREASEENVFTSESATQAPVLEYTAYPNPTSRVIYLKASDSSLKGKIQTTLYDEGGHVIYSQPYDLGSNSGIDLGRFPTGIYFLRTEDPLFGSSTHKIIKE